ncbi:hypothetical protein QEN19_001697 [Hanseniaspora menglaensis]
MSSEDSKTAELQILLKRFVYSRTLSDDQLAKSVCLLGHIPANDEAVITDTNRAIIHISRLPIDPTDISGYRSVKNAQINDCYHWGETFLATTTGDRDCKVTLLYPASKKHLNKYDKQHNYVTIIETPEMYQSIVKPYIDFNISEGSINWVYNILSGQKEQEQVKYQNSNFLAIPDMKWTDQSDLKSMYILLLFKDTRLKSIRDLHTCADLDLLKSIKVDVQKHVLKQYGDLPLNKVKLYFHYQPSYYQLHIHIVHCDNEVNYKSMLLGKDCHFIDTVIDNLEMNIDYYKKCKLVYCLNDDSELYKRIENSE